VNWRKICRSVRVSTAEMRYGRALLAGLGWAGTLGCVALCVLIFLSAYLVFDGKRAGVEPRKNNVVRLPAVPDAKVPRVSLATPPRRLAAGRSARREGGVAGRGGARRVPTAPRAPTPGGAPQAPGGGTPPRGNTSPPPAPAQPGPYAASGGGGGGTPPAPQRTLGDTTRDVVHVVGNVVGQVSPPAGQVVDQAGDTVGDTVDSVIPPLRLPGS
jgi:hypothetical protein